MPNKKVPKPKVKDVLAVFLNPAGVPDSETAVPAGVPTRDNQPWFVVFCSLGIILQARDRKDQPICGYWDAQEAGAWAASMYSQIVADPEYLAHLRTNPETMPAVWDGYKMMSRRITVPIA